jgi:alpha-tubulin suppressor-like RCC1 family protein|eukprot:COSAG01_NODE_2528_length_7497_cov_487.755204_3_plen_449_part_00
MAAGFKSSARPVLCRAPGPCAEVFLGADHTVLRTRDGGLYSCGRGDSGQLGQGDMHHYFEPTRVAALNADPLRLVAVAGARTVGVSSQDNFYIWGKSWGDGHGGVRALRGCKSHTPTVVAALSKKCIESVSIGSEHGSACDNIGTVYTFGSSNEHLQLGTVTPWPEEGEQVDPLKVNVNEATSVRAVVCGSNHSLSVTSEDEGYTWGCNMNGQLGLGHKRPTQRPALLGSFKKKAAQKLLSQVFAGGDYNAVFANDIGPGKAGEQQLYMWGKNLYGQLGLGHTTEMSTPQHMNHLSQPIRLLSCGPNHVLAVCGENSVYAWGRGVHGQLGNGYVSKQTKPRLITNLASSQVGTIVHVGAGDNHSACVTSKGAVYTWGSDLYGQLGIGEGKSASSRVGLDADVELPSLDTSLSSPVKFDENLRSFGTVSCFCVVDFARLRADGNADPGN